MARKRYYLHRHLVEDVLDAEHLTQQQLARRLEISAPHLSRLMHGHRPLSPRVRQAFKLCVLFADHIDDLWSEVPQTPSAA